MPGVTAKTITLGELTDLSGPFAGANRAILAGHKLYWSDVNAKGGVCGRTVELDVQDHKFDPQNAVSLYRAMRDRVLGFQASNGSPTTAAIMDMVEADRKFTLASVYAPRLLGRSALVVPGTTYDIEAINGVDFLVRERGLKQGGALAVANIPGEYGESVRAGVRTAAEHSGLRLSALEIPSGSTDLTATLAALRSEGIHYVVLGATSAQVVSLASLAEAANYDLTIMVTNVLAPDALKGPARVALEKRVLLLSNTGPFDAPYDGFEALRKKFLDENPNETPTYFINLGLVGASIYHKVLERACADGPLTDESVIKAARSLQPIDFGKAHSPVDLRTPTDPASRSTFVLKPDGNVLGGTSLIAGPFSSPLGATVSPAAAPSAG